MELRKAIMNYNSKLTPTSVNNSNEDKFPVSAQIAELFLFER